LALPPQKNSLDFSFWSLQPKTNAAATTYLNQIFEYMSHHGNPSLTDMTLPRPQFRHCFFESSPCLMTGRQNLVISNGLHYAKTVITIPEEISCWHFLSSL